MSEDSRTTKALDARDDLDRQVQDLTESLRLEYFRRWDQFRAGLTQLQGAHARVRLAKERQEHNERERLKAIKWGVVVMVLVFAVQWFKSGSLEPSTSDLFILAIGYGVYFYLTFIVRERDQLRLEDIQAEKDRLEFNVEAAGVNSVYLAELYRHWDKRREDENSYPHDDEKFDSIDIFNRIQKVILDRVTS